MEAIWAASSTALLVFCIVFTYKFGFVRGRDAGYKKGASEVLQDWKHYMKGLEEDE